MTTKMNGDANKIIHLDRLSVDISFLLIDTFYTGDPNNHTQLNDPSYRQPIILPDIPRAADLLLGAREVIGSEAELIRYYQDILQHAQQIGRSCYEIRHYFWMRLWLWHPEMDIYLPFPWYDTHAPMQNLFAHIRAGESYQDVEQDWNLSVSHEADATIIVVGSGYDAADKTGVSIANDYLIQQINQCEQRTQSIIQALSEALGADVWSTYLEDAVFTV